MSTEPDTPQSTGETANLPATADQTGPARVDGWTVERQVTFLDTLASTHSVARAARAAGMSRQSAYSLRARLKGEPFDLAWRAAFQCRFDTLAEAALDRALNGVEVPHFYRGELVGTSRRFDERLTVALLAMQHTLSAPPHVRKSDPAASYGDADFGRLLARVERGPETWVDEQRQELTRMYEEQEAAGAASSWDDPGD